MEEHIGVLDIWDSHVCSLIYKGLYMLEDSSHVEERHICVVCQNEYESRKGNIGRTLLQVQYDKSDGVRDFLGVRGTAHCREAPLVVGTGKGEVGAE